jgi:two-component system, OmpR family, alkaline phosphatase synthesis response regulator PhoP
MAKKVLICDDKPYVLESVGYVVREEGYEFLTADNGEDALRLARTEMPDLIFLDVMMPAKSGFQVCRELKSDPSTRGIYTILLTAMGQERDEQEGFQCGAEEYMTKPFSPRALRRKLHQLLD